MSVERGKLPEEDPAKKPADRQFRTNLSRALIEFINSLTPEDFHEYYRLPAGYLLRTFTTWTEMVQLASEYLIDVENDKEEFDDAAVRQATAEGKMAFVRYLYTLPEFQKFKAQHGWEIADDYSELRLSMMLVAEPFPGQDLEIIVTQLYANIIDHLFSTSMTPKLKRALRWKPNSPPLKHLVELHLTDGEGNIVEVIREVKISVRPDATPMHPSHVYVSEALHQRMKNEQYRIEIVKVYTDPTSLATSPKTLH